MKELQKKLQRDLLRQPGWEILETDLWGLPVELLRVSYTTVKRAQMDVLMKMMLLSMQKMKVSSPAEIGAFLSVEPLFTEHMIKRLEATSMIQTENEHYILTDTGYERLESGIFEHPPEMEEQKLLYSPSHQAFWGEKQEIDTQDDLKPYRWQEQTAQDTSSLKQTQLIEALQTTQPQEEEKEGLQVIFQQIETPELLETLWAPCLEFHVRNGTDDTCFTRVWNTMLGKWDARLEQQIDEHGALTVKND